MEDRKNQWREDEDKELPTAFFFKRKSCESVTAGWKG